MRTYSLILATLALSYLSSAYCADSLNEAMKTGKALFTQADLEAWEKEIRPVVEKVAQRTFKTPPKVQLIERSDLFEILTKDLMPQLKALKPGTNDLMLQLDALQVTANVSAGLLAKYAFSDSTCYVVGDNFQPVFALGDIPESSAPAIAKLAIAHELVHALQDQEVDLSTYLSSAKTPNDALIRNIIIEGHAMLLADQVADQLELSTEARLLDNVMPGGSAMLKKYPAIAIKYKKQRDRQRLVYQGGKAYAESVYKTAGLTGLWARLAKPPTSTEEMGETVREMFAEQNTQSKLAALVEGLENHHSKRMWNGTTIADHNKLMTSYMRTQSADSANAIRAIVTDSVSRIVRCPPSGKSSMPSMFNVVAFSLNPDKDPAPAFAGTDAGFEFVAGMLTNAAKQAGKSKVERNTSPNAVFNNTLKASIQTMKITVADDSTLSQTTASVLVTKSLYLQITCMNLPLEKAHVQKLLDEITKRNKSQ